MPNKLYSDYLQHHTYFTNNIKKIYPETGHQ